MAYGRLDVFSPDGPIQTFPLIESTVSVGRSAGNTITLDNNTISRYHFSLTHDNEQVYISDMDSANGTYVDGMKLGADERRPLMDGEEILIGNLRIIYHIVDDTPTVKLEALEDTTQRVEMALASFYIDLQGPGQGVAPGAHISAELSITNTTDEDERFRVEVSGLPEDWVRIDRPTPLVSAGDTTFVLINFKPTRHSSSKPGDYNVRVRVYPKNQPKDVLEAHLMLTVLPFGSFSMHLERRDLTAGDRYRLVVQNGGSAPLPLSLRGVDRTGELNFRFATAQFSLAPGQQRIIEVEAQPRKTLLVGQPRRYTFDLLAQSRDHARFMIPLRAHLTVRPALPVWVALLLAAGAGLMVLALVVAALAIFTAPPPQPNFTSFNVSQAELARGDVLEVSWQATDVARVQLSLNGTPVATENDPQRVSLSVDTEDFSGEVEVLLEGFNGDQVDSESMLVLVYEPMRVEHFAATPPQLVRYVVQGLTLEWDVPGAVFTRVTGLESFAAVDLTADGPSAAFADIPGIPTDPLLLTLTGEDQFGNVLSSNLTVNVVNPECAPATGPVRLFVGPNPAHQVVGTIPQDAVVVVDARDQSGGWVRIIGLSGGLSGWAPAATLRCNDNFDVQNLRIETNVPTPPPTLTPTQVPSATPSPLPTFTATTPTAAPTLAPLATPSG